MGLEVGRPTTTDHVAGNAAEQKPGGGAEHPVAITPRSAAIFRRTLMARHF
jgi:hypothetical protein